MSDDLTVAEMLATIRSEHGVEESDAGDVQLVAILDIPDLTVGEVKALRNGNDVSLAPSAEQALESAYDAVVGARMAANDDVEVEPEPEPESGPVGAAEAELEPEPESAGSPTEPAMDPSMPESSPLGAAERPSGPSAMPAEMDQAGELTEEDVPGVIHAVNQFVGVKWELRDLVPYVDEEQQMSLLDSLYSDTRMNFHLVNAILANLAPAEEKADPPKESDRLRWTLGRLRQANVRGVPQSNTTARQRVSIHRRLERVKESGHDLEDLVVRLMPGHLYELMRVSEDEWLDWAFHAIDNGLQPKDLKREITEHKRSEVDDPFKEQMADARRKMTEFVQRLERFARQYEGTDEDLQEWEALQTRYTEVSNELWQPVLEQIGGEYHG